MDNYTKGEWKVTGYPHIDGEPDVTHFRIGAVTEISDEHIAFADGRGVEENKANANLMALSPRMYEALKNSNKTLEFLRDKSGFTGKSLGVLYCNSAIEINNKVLDKANGEVA